MTIIKKIIMSGASALMILLAGNVAHAATSNVAFDTAGGALSVSGTCSGRYVMVIIRRTSDNSIWGSSNPSCESGSYKYQVDVPDSDRTGAMFTVQAFDEASADGGAPNASGTPKLNTPVQTVEFSEAPTPMTEITLDTSSLPIVSTDQTFLDGVLSQFFGIVADVNDAVQNFGTIIANTVKASLIATVDLFSKNITVLPGGSISVPRGTNQLAGSDWLSAGVTDIFIPNTSITSSSQIIITPTSPSDIPLAVTQKNDGSGFHVGALRAPSAAISFDWLIVQTYGAAAPAQSQQSGGGAAQPTMPAPIPTPTPAPISAPAPNSIPTPAPTSDSSTVISDTLTQDIASTSTDNVATTSTTPTTTATTTTPDDGSNPGADTVATSSQN